MAPFPSLVGEISTELPDTRRQFDSRQDCLEVMWNRSAELRVPHCEPDWEPLTALCWAPTPAGLTASLPCPPYEHLNPTMLVNRTCQPNATWYVNASFDDKPFSNYYDCFIPREPTSEEKLRQFVNEKTLQILKTLANNAALHLSLLCVDIFLLIIALVLCFIVIIRTERRYQYYKYIIVVIAAITLIFNHLTTISVQTFENVSYIAKCRVAKTLVSFSNIIFCQCLLGYVLLYIVKIMDYTIRKFHYRLGFALPFLLALTLVGIEVVLEIFYHNNRYCGFGTQQTLYHWIITAPKFFIMACTFCLNFVVIFGVYFLKQPLLMKNAELSTIRRGSFCVFAMSFYNVICENLLVMLHTSAAMEYQEQIVVLYTHAYSAVAATRGIVLTFCMCFIEMGMLALLPCQCARGIANPLERVRAEMDGGATASLATAQNSSGEDNEEYDDEKDVKVRCSLAKGAAVTPSEPPRVVYESTLRFGPLKYNS